MVHAPNASFGEECMNMYRLISSIGRPADETLSLGRMIVRGIWEQFPTLKLVGAHLGGGICEVIGRMDYAYELGDFCFFLGDYEPLLITKKPSEYMKLMYMDTASYWPPTLVCALMSVGADHLVFGSDAPPLAPLLPRAKQLIEEMPIGDEERQMIFSGNAFFFCLFFLCYIFFFVSWRSVFLSCPRPPPPPPHASGDGEGVDRCTHPTSCAI
jgi:aminocarboxymuconate-semialdehyde decarboxylase